MKKSMIIKYDDGSRRPCVCPSCKIDYTRGQKPNNEVIPIFYSEEHASDAGWRKITLYRFSKNGEPVWVCPKCWPDNQI